MLSQNFATLCPMTPIVSIPNTVRTLRATEALLDRVYTAARTGLKGDALALASGILPAEYKMLCQHDEKVELAAMKGKADSEMEHATLLADASRGGDAKASLAILQHLHGWTARHDVRIEATHTIDIKTLLAERAARIYEGTATNVE